MAIVKLRVRTALENKFNDNNYKSEILYTRPKILSQEESHCIARLVALRGCSYLGTAVLTMTI